MVTAKTASGNVAFKVARMRESITIIYYGGSGRAYIIHNIRKSDCEELGLEANNKAALEDVGHNTDLYIANQEDNTQN